MKRASRCSLSDLMSSDPDVTLVFTSEDGQSSTVESHCSTLNQCSTLAQALKLAETQQAEGSKDVSTAKDSNTNENTSSSKPATRRSSKRSKKRSTSTATALSSGCMLEVPMPESSRDDFLAVAAFLYPVEPQPMVSWDNLEVPSGASRQYWHW